jgi:hypothetical protein
MTDGKTKMKALAESLRSGKKASVSMTVRELLQQFGAQRRGTEIVREVRRGLRLAGLRTEPEFTTTHIDARIVIAPSLPKRGVRADGDEADRAEAPPPTRTLGTLRAGGVLRSVTPGDKLEVALTKMAIEASTELAVLQGPKYPKGIISWATIGMAFATGKAPRYVSDCTKEVPLLGRDTPLLEAIDLIVGAGAVLVQDKEKTVVGLVTPHHIASEFTALAKPFFLLGEIEEQLRRICRGLPLAMLRAGRSPQNGREVSEAHHLSLGELVRLLEDPKKWQLLKLRAHQPQVVKRLNKVCAIRNDVMHFDPDPPTDDEIATLIDLEKFLRGL